MTTGKKPLGHHPYTATGRTKHPPNMTDFVVRAHVKNTPCTQDLKALQRYALVDLEMAKVQCGVMTLTDVDYASLERRIMATQQVHDETIIEVD